MAFCSNCGKVIPDGTTCDCQSNISANPLEIQKPKKKKTGLFLVLVAVLIIVIIVVSLLSAVGGGYKAPINDLVNGINKCSSKKIISAVIPDDYLDDIKEKLDDMDMDWKDFTEEIDDNLEDVMDEMEDRYGKRAKLSVKFLDKKKATKSALKDIQEEYEDDFDCEVTKAYKVKVEIRIKGKDDEDKNKGWLYVVKVKGSGWKVYPDDDDTGITNMVDFF